MSQSLIMYFTSKNIRKTLSAKINMTKSTVNLWYRGLVTDREAWHAAVHRAPKSQMRPSN